MDVSIQWGAQLATLAFSFISLAAFGSFLLAENEITRRLFLLIPIGLEAVWVFGLYDFSGQYTGKVLWAVADAWTRYTLAIPSSLLTAIGLVVQQRAFRRLGLIRFGRDALWAAITFGWYGLFGQIFTRETPLFPSNLINQQTFLDLFGFPIQLFRTLPAVAAALFVIRFLRAFQVETEREQEVLTYLAEGSSHEEIAASLVISPKTVARHRENIMRKLNLHSRAELVRYAIRKGIIKA